MDDASYRMLNDPDWAEKRRQYLLQRVLDQWEREKVKGHAFTRRAYRVARRRALHHLLITFDAYQRTPLASPDWLAAQVDYTLAKCHAQAIVDRGRREKGMWT